MALRDYVLALCLAVVILGASVTSLSTDSDWDDWYNRAMGVKIDELDKRGNGLGSARYVRCIKRGTNKRCFCDMLRSPKDPGYYLSCSKFSLKATLDEEK